jgi:hypothetical protein
VVLVTAVGGGVVLVFLFLIRNAFRAGMIDFASAVVQFLKNFVYLIVKLKVQNNVTNNLRSSK